jgi:hypothetical protein
VIDDSTGTHCVGFDGDGELRGQLESLKKAEQARRSERCRRWAVLGIMKQIDRYPITAGPRNWLTAP